MKKYIRVVNNTVAEAIEIPSTVDIKQLYHPDILSQFQPSKDSVQVGWILKDGDWVAPPVVEPPPLPAAPTEQQTPPAN